MKHYCQDNKEIYSQGRLWRCTICGCGGFTKEGYKATRQGTLRTLVRRGKITILNQEV